MNIFEKEEYEKEFEGKTIIITGGLGFIGSNLAHRLVKLNPKKIIIIDALIPGQGGNLYNIKDIQDKLEIVGLNEGGRDISDDRILECLEEVDYIFNLAGSVNHIGSKNKPLDDLKINLLSHVSLLDNCKKYIENEKSKLLEEEKINYKPKFKILFSATRDIYGKTVMEDIPLKENFLIRETTDPQGIHNHTAEFHHLWYGRQYGFPVISLRLSNTYGPRQKIDDPTQGFLGYFIYKSLNNEEIELWGGGESLRDFNYVEDVIDAMLLAMTSEKAEGNVYNLGGFMRMNGKYQEMGGNICSVGEAAKKVVEIADKGSYRIIPYPEEKKAIEPGHVYLDSTKIHNDLGWYPKTSFDEGLTRTLNFFRENNQEYIHKELRQESVPFLDLRDQHKEIEEEIGRAIKGVLNSSHFVLGNQVNIFESEFAKYCGKNHAIGVGNGTAALTLSLRSLNIGKGDEVIVPNNTAIPTVMAIKDSGAEPKLIDINEKHLMKTEEIEGKINERTKAIMPVHLYGQACDMDPIMEIAKRNNLKIIEDCCQAHGAEYKGAKVPISEMGCFSFYPSKNLGSLGEGGMIVCDNEETRDKLNLLRNYGQSSKYHADIIGVNSRLDELHAAVLRVKLRHLDKWNGKRKNLAKTYDEFLKDTPEVITIPHNSENVYHLYVIRVKNREGLQEYLKSKGIITLIHYPIPISKQRAFSYLDGEFPNSEKYSEEILSLPMFPELSENKVKIVCKEIKNYYGS